MLSYRAAKIMNRALGKRVPRTCAICSVRVYNRTRKHALSHVNAAANLALPYSGTLGKVPTLTVSPWHSLLGQMVPWAS